MSGSTRALRDFAEADLPALVDLWVAAWNETGLAIDFDARHAWLIDHLSVLRAGGAEIVVGLDTDGWPAGFAAMELGEPMRTWRQDRLSRLETAELSPPRPPAPWRPCRPLPGSWLGTR